MRWRHRTTARAKTRHARVAGVLLATLLALTACDRGPPPPTPAEIRARIARLLPATAPDRSAWAADIQAAFTALGVEPSSSNLCAVLAVIEQESTYRADPPVPGLADIARREIEQRAARLHVPAFMARAALALESPDGRGWSERLAAVRTERELSELFESMVDTVPLGRRLFAGANPVRTGGPMQVSIAFAEQHARSEPYPYPVDGSIRREVFTRRGGLYFGIAHLLDYPAPYERPLYRFADFNAGRYASRNAAFQRAVSTASGIELELDGDPLDHGGRVGPTEAALHALAEQLGLDEARIRRDLGRAARHDFERTTLYRRLFALAESVAARQLPRAVMPHIELRSPKIRRRLTTAWFAGNVDRRHRACMARAAALPGG